MFLYGASGHAKVIIDILKANNMSIDGIFDDDQNITQLLGIPVHAPCLIDKPLIVSIGNNKVRRTIVERNPNCIYGSAVHPSAIISPTSTIGKGTVVMQGAIIQADSHIGEHCIINTAATIDHDCIIGDYVHISPKATLCGNVSVGEGSQIGAGSVVVQGVKIGKWSLVCAGSVVTKDIPDNCIAAGNFCEVKRFYSEDK